MPSREDSYLPGTGVRSLRARYALRNWRRLSFEPTPVAAMAAVALLLACSSSTLSPENGEAAPIQTDRASYQLREKAGYRPGYLLQVEIPYRYHNATGKTVCLVNCRGAVQASLEKRLEGNWVMAWGGVYAGCLSPAIEIGAGTVYEDTMIVAAVQDQSGNPRFTVEPIDGVYRIVLSSTHTVHNYNDSYLGGSWGDPLPLAARISNEFALSK